MPVNMHTRRRTQETARRMVLQECIFPSVRQFALALEFFESDASHKTARTSEAGTLQLRGPCASTSISGGQRVPAKRAPLALPRLCFPVNLYENSL